MPEFVPVMTDDKAPELVIHIDFEERFGTKYLIAKPMLVDTGESWPSNITDGLGAYHKEYADLELAAYAMDYPIGDRYVNMHDPRFHHVMHIDSRRAASMAKVLQRVDRALAKANAHEPGDVFMTFAKVLGAKRIVFEAPESKKARHSWLKDSEWCWGSITEGRDRFRRLIRELEEESRKKHSVAA